MSLTDELFALVPADAVDHVTATLRHRVPADDIEVRAPERGSYPVRDERLHEEVKGARHGALSGGAGGAVVGIVVAALVNPATAPVWVLIAFCGAAFGALVGGVIGLQLHDVSDDRQALEVPVEDPAAVRLVRIRTEHHLHWAHKILEHSPGVRFLEADVPTSS